MLPLPFAWVLLLLIALRPLNTTGAATGAGEKRAGAVAAPTEAEKREVLPLLEPVVWVGREGVRDMIVA